MKKIFYSSSIIGLICLLILNLVNHSSALAQGCVAIRQMSTYSVNGSASTMSAKQWQISASYRYFRSHRHFVGTDYQEQRKTEGTEVINISNSLDISLSYSFSKRFSLGLTVPLSYTDRSSLYEHLGNSSGQRFSTQSSGLGDIRLSGNYWMLDPDKHPSRNIALGLGVKAPTGNYDVQDDFHKSEGLVRKTVDQSLQLGDGGWGITLEMQAFQKLSERAFAYTNAFYLLNPRVQVPNGTRSTPDQFSARAGVTYVVLPHQGISVGLGGRIEGLPAKDLIGSSVGGRRPGYIISVEPSINYSRGKDFFALNVPIALVRNRTKSVSDIASGKHGDAAFADYLISISYAHRF